MHPTCLLTIFASADCYVVKQHDKHWPYLSVRETLSYAAELYNVADKAYIGQIVEEIIRKMGMESCADTRNVALSGGQRRRLSIGVALLKQPTLLFLGESVLSKRFLCDTFRTTNKRGLANINVFILPILYNQQMNRRVD